jgi:hypothetical protein
MANPFDALPLEVIRDVIFPFLDYNGWNALNRFMGKDAISTPFEKDAVLIVHFKLAVIQLTNALRKLDTTTKTSGRARIILYGFRYILSHPILLRYSSSLRQAVLSLIDSYSSPDSVRYERGSKYFKKTCLELCAKILNTLPPFEREINSKLSEDWSPIKEVYSLNHRTV